MDKIKHIIRLALDKKKHIIRGLEIAVPISVAIGLFWIRDLMILGGVVAVLVGIGKELIWDKWLHKGTPEFDDAWATAWAGLTGSIICYFIL
jgi:hypothetical protein